MATCQYCGDPTPSARAKQCAACRELKDHAFKAGTYGSVMRALATYQLSGMRGAALRAAAVGDGEADLAARQAMDATREAAWEAARLARQTREEAISRKRAAGWHWEQIDAEGMDAFGATAYTDLYGAGDGHWVLVPPEPANI